MYYIKLIILSFIFMTICTFGAFAQPLAKTIIYGKGGMINYVDNITDFKTSHINLNYQHVNTDCLSGKEKGSGSLQIISRGILGEKITINLKTYEVRDISENINHLMIVSSATGLYIKNNEKMLINNETLMLSINKETKLANILSIGDINFRIENITLRLRERPVRFV